MVLPAKGHFPFGTCPLINSSIVLSACAREILDSRTAFVSPDYGREKEGAILEIMILFSYVPFHGVLCTTLPCYPRLYQTDE